MGSMEIESLKESASSSDMENNVGPSDSRTWGRSRP